MKRHIKIHVFLITIVSSLLLGIIPQKTFAQDEKNSVRISASYIKIMGVSSSFEIKASSRINKKTMPVGGIELTITNDANEENISIGKVVTNAEGKVKFDLKEFSSLLMDDESYYNFTIQFSGNDAYDEDSESIRFKDAKINAELITEDDDVNSIKATLIDSSTDTPIEDAVLIVQLQRLFRPLIIGEDYNSTDEDGTIVVEIKKGIPGVDGKLYFEVLLKDSEDYGTVKAIVETSIGVPIIDKSTFDQRTLWGSREKAPIILLVSLNIMLFGIWGTLLYLIYNLFRISKS
ncbi:hypothetical protein [Lutibacter sp.]|uniref:hypothetical protein n=1 Tax=Lutibacter sp. TaxID=1925666 RepID=UPI0035682523